MSDLNLEALLPCRGCYQYVPGERREGYCSDCWAVRHPQPTAAPEPEPELAAQTVTQGRVGDVDGATFELDGPNGVPLVIASAFVAIKREPIVPILSTHDGRTTLLARGRSMLIGGPSDASKSLAANDLVGKMAGDGGDWLGLKVRGGLKVALVVYPGEGEDEDLVERIKQLVPAGAQLFVWDHWRTVPAPLADDQGVRMLAGRAKEFELDAIAFDTLTSFFRGAYDCSRGIPEDAHDALAALRSLSGRPLAIVGTQHTRKRDTRATTTIDELEELSGTFARKVDGAVVIRKDGESKRRRRVTFAKTRRGPKPDPVIAALPDDETEPPRLSVVASALGEVKTGTDADLIAAWIREQPEPQMTSVLTARFNIGDTTLRNRRDQLEARGILHAKAPWAGWNAHAYGTTEQWQRKVGERLGIPMEEGSQ